MTTPSSLVAAGAVVAAAATAVGPAPLRVVAALGLVLVAPGLAWVGHLPARAAPETAALVVALSIGVTLVAAVGLLLVGWLGGPALAVVAVLVTLAGAITRPEPSATPEVRR